jgi:tetratricopeptide (TPR) repeat protein
MLYRLVIIFLLGLAASSVKAETLKGRIVENKIQGRGLAHVEIVDEAQSTNPTISDDWGRFSLDFPTKHAGDTVRLIVNKEGYVVVNSESLDLRLPATAKVDDTGTIIVVCQQKDFGECRLRYYQLTVDALNYAASKSKEQVVKGDEPKEIDFQRYIKEWALQYGLSAEQAQAEVEQWVAEVQQKRNSASNLALAEFYQKHFGKAAELFQQSAQDKIGELEKLQRKEEETRKEKRKLTAGIVNDLRREGDACYNDYRFMEAVASYQKALEYATRESDPQLWAATLVDVGRAHAELGIRVEGKAGNEHLAAAITAYRSALEVYTREQLPQEWAMTQNNLGNALRNQAARTAGAPGAELLGQAVAAYRSALEVRTREQLPQDWAATQNNLAIALRDQAARTAGAKGAELLAQAVAAFRCCLEIYTAEAFPFFHDRAQEQLKECERLLAKVQAQ